MKSIRTLTIVVVAVTGLALAPSAALAVSATLQVVPVGHGSVSFSPAPIVSDPDPCSDVAPGTAVGVRTDIKSGSCKLTYDAGEVVTLKAQGGPETVDPDPGPATQFRAWSDDRCQPATATTCSIRLEPGMQTIAALFSPQRVSWWNVGGGSVDAPPSNFPDVDCSDGSPNPCVGRDYDLGTDVSLTASGPDPATWLDKPDPTSTNQLAMCDAVVGAACRLAAVRPRWAAATFAGAPFQENVPPEVLVQFRIRKAGGGSGTVRSQSLDCGTSCAIEDVAFGASETLQAAPDSGSRFTGWRGACGSAPTCRLAVGPVTAITAVFERAAAPQPGPGPTPALTPGPSLRKAGLVKRGLVKLNVRGHGRKRAILMRVELGAPGTVKARLLRGRRQVTARKWQLNAGSYLLRMKVPARVRPGRYRVGLTVTGGGQTQQITRPVRLRR